jgi:hypothetical protein
MLVKYPAPFYLRYPLKMIRWIANIYLGFIINSCRLVKVETLANDLQAGLDNFNSAMKEWIGK